MKLGLLRWSKFRYFLGVNYVYTLCIQDLLPWTKKGLCAFETGVRWLSSGKEVQVLYVVQ